MSVANPAFTLQDETTSATISTYSGVVSVHSEPTDDVQYKCGYGRWEPKWMQKLHNAKCLLLCLSLCTITQGFVVNGIVPVSITTLEKRFNINSTQSGLFSAFYDISVLLVLIPVCHWGNKGHKGRWLAWGVFMMGMGSVICTLPQFTTGVYKFDQHSASDTCGSGLGSDECDSEDKAQLNLRNYFYVLLFGQLLHGIGASPLYTLGITYLDENVSQRASPMYLGLFTAFATVGPAIGYIVGSYILQIYGDVGKVDTSTLDLPDINDPRWYGAWWIGFVMSACMGFAFCIPLFSFARQLPGAQHQRSKDIDQVNQMGGTNTGFGEDLRDLPKSFLALLKNPTYTGLIVMQTAEAFLLNGFVTFIPKLFENIFNFSASTASLVAGAIVVPSGFFGNIIGGFLIRKLKLKCQGMIVCALIFSIASGLLVLIFLTQCPEVGFAGVSAPYANKSSTFTVGNLSSTCNSDCECSAFYKPVCNAQLQMSYFSPCRAGCVETVIEDGKTVAWSNCSCVADAGISLTESRVSPGLCGTTCSNKYLFMALFGLLVTLTFCSSMPVQQAQLRCVPFRQRTMGIGFGWIFIRAFGSIPGPILFGVAFDGICLLWKYQCGEAQTCLRYSGRELALTVMTFGLCFKVLIVSSLVAAILLYRAPVAPTARSQCCIAKDSETDVDKF